MRRLLIVLVLFCQTSLVQAGVLVLVHGWAANADTWWRSGVMQVLEANGWGNAGVVVSLPDGAVRYFPGPASQADNRVYLASLPAEAPLQIQAAYLLAELNYIHRLNADEKLTIAGHSAGGVVARLAIVNPAAPPVKQLVTIASPNLGTGRALQGLDIADSKPFFCPGPGIDFLKTMVGGSEYRYLRDSRGALVGMVPAAPGSLLAWLNRQPHPSAAYAAIIHQPAGVAGDGLVPAFSQDLNNVPALRGRVTTYPLNSGHALNPGDGQLLVRILGQ